MGCVGVMVGEAVILGAAVGGTNVDVGETVDVLVGFQVARQKLGDTRFETLAIEGRLMTMEQAIAYALEESANP